MCVCVCVEAGLRRGLGPPRSCLDAVARCQDHQRLHRQPATPAGGVPRLHGAPSHNSAAAGTEVLAAAVPAAASTSAIEAKPHGVPYCRAVLPAAGVQFRTRCARRARSSEPKTARIDDLQRATYKIG